MISQLAVLMIPSAILLANHAQPDADVSYTCKFEAGVIVIDHPQATGRATVQIGGDARPYIVDEQKLVPMEAGLPTYYFQSELKRWKRLNQSGETVETTVCKSAISSSKADARTPPAVTNSPNGDRASEVGFQAPSHPPPSPLHHAR
ncbi:hypothetical protein C8D03_4428 [Bosea sp. 124]|nr:hypothetical protein C8D03_4428 [Bosea sp. 124]